jgi:hypothetical protein
MIIEKSCGIFGRANDCNKVGLISVAHHILVYQIAYHFLILGPMFDCLVLEKIHTAFIKKDRDLDCLLRHDQFLRGRQEIFDPGQFSYRRIKINFLCFYSNPFLCANIRRL